MLATTRISFALVVTALAAVLFAGCMSGAALQQASAGVFAFGRGWLATLLRAASEWVEFALAAARGLSAAFGLLATLLFVGVTGISTGLRPLSVLSLRPRKHWMRDWGQWRFSTLGILFTGVLTLLLGVLAVGWQAGVTLAILAVVLATLLNVGSWLLTRFYWRLPEPANWPLWALAVQGLARHRRQTAGMTLAMTAGALGVGLAALGWVSGDVPATFPLWVAAMLLVACASLVLTTSALAALERRQELGLLAALGARRTRVRGLILLENGIVAVAGGMLGAMLAVVAWSLVGSEASQTRAATVAAIALLDVMAALTTAWIGALPVLWLIARQPPAASLRDQPWLTG